MHDYREVLPCTECLNLPPLTFLSPPVSCTYVRLSAIITGTAYATGETQLGVLEYDDMLELRRASDEISSKIVTYVNHIAEHLPGVSEPPLSMLDAFPEL